MPENKNIMIMLVPKEATSEWTRWKEFQLIKFSRQYTSIILPIIEDIKPDFVSIEACKRDYKNFGGDHLFKALKSRKINYIPPAILEEASSYIKNRLAAKKQLNAMLMTEAASISREPPNQYENIHILNLEACTSMLEGDNEDEENHISGIARDSWIVKGIFDKTCTIEEKNIKILHIGDESHLFGLNKFFSLLRVKSKLMYSAKELRYSSEANPTLVRQQEVINHL